MLLGLLSGFWLTEISSYFLHRFVFHGTLWNIHKSHHSHTDGILEHNDAFSLFFSLVSIGLIAAGFGGLIPMFWAWFGVGVSIYGLLYFVIHDLMTHRRFFPLKPTGKIVTALSKAHLIHHQSHDKVGQEPYGLFLVHPSILARVRRKKGTKKSGSR